ncbi:hypothetical protein jhhlp_000162 [Lomentospora prolificans]|uniref:histidine kinase n=1 Tax=Lomentospora prolificans TaxID=41688 RepID=A0A2N3NLW6_9PEZI|nr:hypothetical protein jhhlp_000162 [Lomentospora prolificans]
MELSANIPYLCDGRRVRQFRRYYQAKHTRHHQSLAGVPPNAVDESPTLPAEADYTFSAIAKCVVHSIDVDKVMISLVDDTTQYFLGGATKYTSSVVRGDESAGLWFGCSTIDIRGGICEVACSVTPDYKDYPFYVVPDIKKIPQWRDVVGDYRFYAGIPIKTKSGDNIGTLFGFSTRSRPNLEPEEKLVMERMANTVMNHLELELSVLERSRVLRMNRSLADFASNKTPAQSPETTSIFSDDKPYLRSPASIELEELPDALPIDPNPTTAASATALHAKSPTTPSPSASRLIRSPTLLHYAASSKVTEPERTTTTPHFSTYKRAAELLRSGLDCSGVIFVSIESELISHRDRSHVNILGSAVSDGGEIPCDFKADALWDGIKSNPDGHLFNFDSVGQPWAIAEKHEEMPPSFSRCNEFNSIDGILISQSPDDPSVKRVARCLQAAIPSARQLLIAPLKSAGDDIVSAAIAWRDDWDAVFSTAVELPFMNCFCSSVFATMMHEDALAANKQKTDFLANISHELRSPLHGVLASVDLLQDTRRSRSQQVLIEDIQNCGRVLLNTIDQLLDLSDLSRGDPTNTKGIREAGMTETSASPKRYSRRLVQPVDADLASLCEDAVHSVLLSQAFHGILNTKGVHNHLTTLSKSSSRKPIVSLDIAYRDWHFMVQPGAVQRVIMNLLGNAVKYTKTGFIRLQLDARDTPPDIPAITDDPIDAVAVLTISDSGCGISPVFMQTHLWTSFAQENHNVSGSGLGLSITRRIITMLGGTIDVQSTVDSGTVVTVEIPLRKPPIQRLTVTEMYFANEDTDSPRAADGFRSRFKKIKQHTQGRTVGVLLRGSLTDGDLQSHAQGLEYANQSVIRCLESWFGLDVLIEPPPGTSLDFAVVDEERVNTAELGRSLPCIILTDGISSRESRRSPGDLSHSAWVKRPVAPGKLERAFSEIVDGPDGGYADEIPRLPSSSGGGYDGIARAGIISRTSSNTDTIGSKRSTSEPPRSDTTLSSENGPRAKTSTPSQPGTAITPSPPALPSPRVLIVDDNAINLKVLSKLLERVGVHPKQIVSASNGLEGVAKFATSIGHKIVADNAELAAIGAEETGSGTLSLDTPVPFDIVLMDLKCPSWTALTPHGRYARLKWTSLLGCRV